MIKKSYLTQVALVLIPFVFSQILLALILQYLHGDYFNSTNWLRWDSGHYLQIAKNGYEYFPCAGKFGYPLDAKEMCGNTGWFPGYPLLIRLSTLLFHYPIIVAGILSKLFYVISLYLVARISDLKEFSLRNILFIAVATFSFGFIYYNAIFPISAVLFFALSGLFFYNRKQIWLTGIFCFLASIFYSTGFLVSFVFAISILLNEGESLKKKLTSFLIPLIMGGLGIFLVFLYFQITVNDWSAFIQVQAKYGHSFQSPIKNIGSFFKERSIFNPYSIQNFIQYQSLLVLIGYVLISFYFFFRCMYKNDLYRWAYIFISLFFLFSWGIGGELSRYRSESLLFPFIFLLKEVKTKYLAIILICLLCIGIPMSYLFFNNVLI